MPIEFEGQDESPLTPEMSAAFKEYPRPKVGADFDARFWNELDARENRYRGLVGLWRRLIEVEIEGIAVWRLGASTCAGAALCALCFVLLSWIALPTNTPAPKPLVASLPETPLAAPRMARNMEELVLPSSTSRRAVKGRAQKTIQQKV